MEVKNHLKNGMGRKSHTSRRNFNNKLLTTLAVLSILFSFNSCGDKEENLSDSGEQPTTLSTPQNVRATVNGTTILVEWNAVANATKYAVYVYREHWGNALGYDNFTTVTSTSTIDKPAYKNYHYYYKVKAINSSGYESEFSNEVTCYYGDDNGGDNETLSTPTGISATQSGTSVVVSWNNVSGATNYKIYRSSNSSGAYSQVGTSSSSSYTDKSPLSGANYYKVAATNSSGESSQSNYAHCNYSGGNTETKPSAPTGVSVANEGSAAYPMITVRWNSVSGATSYKVYRSTSVNGTYSQLGSTNSTVLTDNSPREGTSYYKVKAVNSAGESDYSSYASFTYKANDVAPCPVTYGNCTVSGSVITMRWTVPTGSGCGTPTKAYLRVRNPSSGVYADVQTLSGTATSASFNYGMWVGTGTYDKGYVYVGIITENDKGTSGGTPKVYDTINKKWIN